MHDDAITPTFFFIVMVIKDRDYQPFSNNRNLAFYEKDMVYFQLKR